MDSVDKHLLLKHIQKIKKSFTAPLRIREALMKANPDYGPVYMYKNDMSDGFYRIRLSTSGHSSLGSFYRYLKDFDNWSHYLSALDYFSWVETLQ